MLQILKTRNIWLSISGAFVAASILAIAIWGLGFGIDFTGGSLLEVKFTAERPQISEVQDKLKDQGLNSLTVQPVGEENMIIRFQQTEEETHQSVLAKLNEFPKGEGSELAVEEQRFDSVGPSIGQELKRNSVYAIFFVLIAIVLYITWSFRKVSKPVASWKYGVAALIALFHDVLITIGVFAVLGKFMGMEVNTPFVAAILTVLGYSVNDTIVVFDRIRENLPKSREDFEGTVNTSLNQTLVRSINTSMTVLLVLLAVIIFGGQSIMSFALALFVGVFVGTYSSIFVASPILVIWDKLSRS